VFFIEESIMNSHLSQTAELDSVRHTLKEIADQAYKISMGLQGAAPAQANGPSPAVRYLLEISLYLDSISRGIDESGHADTLSGDKKSGVI